MIEMNGRKLTEEDYDSFYELIRDFRETTFSKEQFCTLLAKIQLSSDIYVIEHNHQLIATGTICYEYKFIFNTCCLAHIEDVCVKKEYRGQGYGKQIVQTLIQVAKEKGCYKVTLDCSDANIAFYEKCQFEKRGNQMSMLLTE
jgi:glucosamine-phosphate N-acetyltransferase